MVKRASAWETWYQSASIQWSSAQPSPVHSFLPLKDTILSSVKYTFTHTILKSQTTHWRIFQPWFHRWENQTSQKTCSVLHSCNAKPMLKPRSLAPNQHAFHYPGASALIILGLLSFCTLFQHVLMGNYPTTCQFSGSSQITPLLLVLSCPSR